MSSSTSIAQDLLESSDSALILNNYFFCGLIEFADGGNAGVVVVFVSACLVRG